MSSTCTCFGLLHPAIARALAVPHHSRCPAAPAAPGLCQGCRGFGGPFCLPCDGTGQCPRRAAAEALLAGALAMVSSLQRAAANGPRARQERLLATLPGPEHSPIRRLSPGDRRQERIRRMYEREA